MLAMLTNIFATDMIIRLALIYFSLVTIFTHKHINIKFNICRWVFLYKALLPEYEQILTCIICGGWGVSLGAIFKRRLLLFLIFFLFFFFFSSPFASFSFLLIFLLFLLFFFFVAVFFFCPFLLFIFFFLLLFFF